MAMNDLAIRDATVLDGLGNDPIQADVRRVNDLPVGGARTIRDPIGLHGVYVNGVRVFDGQSCGSLGKGPGRVLDRFLPARSASPG